MKNNKVTAEQQLKALSEVNEKVKPTRKIIPLNKYKKRNKESEVVIQALYREEVGDASLFINKLWGEFVYDNVENVWYYWNDHYWRMDKAENIWTKINIVAELYEQELIYENEILAVAQAKQDEKQIKISEGLIKKLRCRIENLMTHKRQKNVIILATKGIDSLWIDHDKFDNNPWLLGVKNGTIDLKTGDFKKGDPEDYIRMICPVKYDADAKCERWEKFICQCMCKDEDNPTEEETDVITYLRLLFGSSISGVMLESLYPVFHGHDGRNGKSTLFEILGAVLGELAYKMPSKFLMQTNNSNGSGPDSDMLALKGKRLVWCGESNKNDKIDSAKIKELTGLDTLTARGIYHKYSTSFKPSHTLCIHTNDKPKAPSGDVALWKRIVLIHFKYTFTENPKPDTNQKKIDRKLKFYLLKKELPGILNWLLEGCVNWYKNGCRLPKVASIERDTLEYRQDQDIVGHFIKACCVSEPDALTKMLDFYNIYKEWCFEDKHHSMSRSNFYKEMDTKFTRGRDKDGRYYKNVLINDCWKDNL